MTYSYFLLGGLSYSRYYTCMPEARERSVMIVSSTDVQNNFGKYLELASTREIVITKNGLPVARLLGMKEAVTFLSDRLVGLLPRGMDEDEAKSGRLSRQ